MTIHPAEDSRFPTSSVTCSSIAALRASSLSPVAPGLRVIWNGVRMRSAPCFSCHLVESQPRFRWQKVIRLLLRSFNRSPSAWAPASLRLLSTCTTLDFSLMRIAICSAMGQWIKPVGGSAETRACVPTNLPRPPDIGRRAPGRCRETNPPGEGGEGSRRRAPRRAGSYRRDGPMSTRIARHFPWRKRSTERTQRVTCPSRIASQMWSASRPTVRSRSAHRPSGTATCDTIEM